MNDPNTPETAEPVSDTLDAGPLTEGPLVAQTFVAAPITENLPADH